MLNRFEVIYPSTVKEAASLLEDYGEEAKILAGGTDLLVMMRDGVLAPDYLINIKKLEDIGGIDRSEGGGLLIGALTSVSKVFESNLVKDDYPVLYRASELFGTYQVRNMGTVGGNICRSSPSSDLAPPLLVLGAKARLIGVEGERVILIEDFFKGPGENILRNEILTEIILPPSDDGYVSRFEKVRRVSADLAKLNCAVRIKLSNGECNNARIALGGVAPTPIRAVECEKLLENKRLNEDLVEHVGEKIGEVVKPITDVRSTKEYRTKVSKELVKRILSDLMGW